MDSFLDCVEQVSYIYSKSPAKPRRHILERDR
jgi:hypothetical protein